MDGGGRTPGAGDLVHTAIFPGSEAHMAAALGAFVEAGLAAGDPVMVNLAGPTTAALAAALGGAGTAVTWTDADAWAAHPGRRLRAIHEEVTARLRGGARAVRFVGECPLRTCPSALVDEWLRMDVALNETLAGLPVTMACVYDTTALAPGAAADVRATHPHLGLPAEPNGAFVAPGDHLAARRPPGLAVPAGAAQVAGRVTPATGRRFLQQALDGVDLAGSACVDLQVVLSELVANAWQAGATSVVVSCWWDGSQVAVQVDDDGCGLWDPLAGYRCPALDAPGGRGLWIIRQLADTVEVLPNPAGTSVRVGVLRPGPGGPDHR